MQNENDNPLVSIIMPVYNGEKYLVEAVISILYQTYKNIELIAVNDGSKDSSQEILESFAAHDSRLKIINQENTGIVGALNNGVAAAKGDLIARMDADDVSFLYRIEKQVAAMLANPQATLVCSGFEIVDEDSQFMYREIVPTRSNEIKRTLLLYNPIAHGSVMFRKAAFLSVGGYSSECGPTEDYELWGRLAPTGEFIALEGALYRWRRNSAGITLSKNAEMIHHTKNNIEAFWRNEPPRFLSRKEILEIGQYYRKTATQYGVDMKNIAYSNIAQISIKEMKRGNVLLGLKQLLALASTGRTGTKWVLKRFNTILRAQYLRFTHREPKTGSHLDDL